MHPQAKISALYDLRDAMETKVRAEVVVENEPSPARATEPRDEIAGGNVIVVDFRSKADHLDAG